MPPTNAPQTKTMLPAVQAASRVMEYVPFGGQDKVKLTVQIVQNLIAVKTKTGKTCSENDAIKFMAMCQARRLNPFEGDAYLLGYDGKDGPQFSLVTAIQAFLKRAEVHPNYNGMKSGVVVKPGYTCSACSGNRVLEHNGEIQPCHICRATGLIDEIEGDIVPEEQTLIGGWAEVLCKERAIPSHKRLLLSRFQKPWGIWQEDPAGMIVKCSECDALRTAFPTMLGGLYLREEVSFIDVKAETVAPGPTFLGPGTPPETSEDAPGPEPAEKPVRPPKTPPAKPEPAKKATPEPVKEPEPEPLPVGEAESAQSDAPEEAPSVEMSWEDCKSFLTKLMAKANVSEDQLEVWLREQKLAKSSQGIWDLQTSKLKDVIARWGEIVGEVQAIQI